MNIKQIIAEEVKNVLKEREHVPGGPGGGGAESPEESLHLLSQVPEDEAEAAVQKLIGVVNDALPKWIEQQDQQKQVAEGLGDWLAGGLAKGLKIIPGGMDLGAMYLASLDREVPATLRMSFLIAIANFVSPVDVGTLLGLDFLGPLAVLDDIILLRRVLKKYQKAGLPADRHYDRIDQLAAGGEDVVKTTEAPAVEAPPEEEGLTERKLKKSTLYKIIREEIEVILTNEEAEEIFDLDMETLLDEMMTQEGFFKGDPGERSMVDKISDFTLPKGRKEDEVNEKEDKWIQGADLKKGRCTPMGTPECPEGSPQYNLAKRFKSGDIHKANLKKGKNPHGPG